MAWLLASAAAALSFVEAKRFARCCCFLTTFLTISTSDSATCRERRSARSTMLDSVLTEHADHISLVHGCRQDPAAMLPSIHLGQARDRHIEVDHAGWWLDPPRQPLHSCAAPSRAPWRCMLDLLVSRAVGRLCWGGHFCTDLCGPPFGGGDALAHSLPSHARQLAFDRLEAVVQARGGSGGCSPLLGLQGAKRASGVDTL